MAVVAIGLQVYDITGSTAAVGLVGFFALVPLVVMGLYGGSLSDHHDRRTVALVANLVAWATSTSRARCRRGSATTNVWVLYLLVAVWNGAFGVSSPARSEHLPADPAARAAAGGQRPRRLRDVGGDDGRPAARRPARRLGWVRRGLHRRRRSSRWPRCGGCGGCSRCRPSRTRRAGRPEPGSARSSTASASCARAPERADDLRRRHRRDAARPAPGHLPGGGCGDPRRRGEHGGLPVRRRGGRRGARDPGAPDGSARCVARAWRSW